MSVFKSEPIPYLADFGSRISVIIGPKSSSLVRTLSLGPCPDEKQDVAELPVVVLKG